MKKLLFICSALFFGVLSPSVSSAVCDERELSGWAMKNSDEYLYQSQSRYNGKFAYECGNGHCDGNQVIFMPANHYFDGKLVTTQKLYYCAARGDQMWVEWSISDIADCDILQCRITDEAAKLGDYYIMDDNGGSIGISTGSKAQLLFTDRTNICKCRTIGEAKTTCENSGGTWTGSACTCDSAKNLRLVSGGGACECISSDYEFDAAAKQCNKKKSVIDEETRIEMGKEDLANKPENIRAKIVEGRVNKLMSQKCLVEQPFVKNPDLTIEALLAGKLEIKAFVRWTLGEGLEKRQDNFAEEVMNQMAK